MVEKLCEKINESLKEEDFTEFECGYDESGKEFVFIYTTPKREGTITQKVENIISQEELSPNNFAVYTLPLREFVHKFLEKIEQGIKWGNRINKLEGDGYALYVNWTNRGIVVHHYENGKFKSSMCKKSPYWESSNGLWIVDIENIIQACNLARRLKEKISEEYGIEFSVNVHKLCVGQHQCE